MNPRSGRERRAIEVYPHPATVVLFGLPRTLKYKQKQGRDVELLRRELLTLVGLVETIVETGPEWDVLRGLVEAAGRKSELRVVEDQVDAVLCAYVARLVRPRAGPADDVRRSRDRLHRHPDPAGRPAGRPGAPRRAGVRRAAAGADRGRRAGDRAGHLDPRRGRHQLPERHRADQERAELRREVRRARSRGSCSIPTRCATSPTRSASGSSPTCTATWPRSPSCSATRWWCTTTATSARRPPARAGSATPAATC